MKITAVEKKKGTRYTVYVDEEYFYILDQEILFDNDIRPGREVDEAFLADVRRQADVRKARERALYLLSYRDHSRKELYDKLCRSVDEEIAAQITDRMVTLGLVDDVRYAEKLARDALCRKKLGLRRASFELQRKGISRELADETLERLSEEIDTGDQLRTLVEKKYARYLVDEKGVKRVTAALARLGHSYPDIKEAIAAYIDRDDALDGELD